MKFVRSRIKSHQGLLGLMVMLKSFQRLGYFISPELVPTPVVNYIRKCLKLSTTVSHIISVRSRRYYETAIRAYLGVNPYDKKAQKLAAMAVGQAALVMEHPADLINVAIEELVKQRYELPAFSTIDRLVGHIRSVINTRLYRIINARLSDLEKATLEQLISSDKEEFSLTLNLLKSPPKSSTLSHMKELQVKFERLMAFGDAKRILSDITPVKIKSWAAIAKALDSSELRDLKIFKRQALLLCLLYQAQVKTRDHLVEMFLKRIQTIHNKAKEKLVELREKHLTQTESLLEILIKILEVSTEDLDSATLGQQVQLLLDYHGGAPHLLQQCSEIAAYNSKNHLPLLWQFYSRHRKVLFDLVRSLEICSTSSDQSLIEALAYVIVSIFLNVGARVKEPLLMVVSLRSMRIIY